jgi:hypothetical protein
LLKTLKARLPSRQEYLPVFAVFVFFGYSWALYRMFWYIPSWLEYMNIWKVLTIAAYVLSFALVESLVMTGLVVLFSLFFPPHLFKEKFVLIGSSLAAVISILAFLLQRKINLMYRLELWQIAVYPVAFLVVLVILVLALTIIYKRLPVLARLVSGLADRITIFTYIYVPFGLLGFVVVLIRNLIGF